MIKKDTKEWSDAYALLKHLKELRFSFKVPYAITDMLRDYIQSLGVRDISYNKDSTITSWIGFDLIKI